MMLVSDIVDGPGLYKITDTGYYAIVFRMDDGRLYVVGQFSILETTMQDWMKLSVSSFKSGVTPYIKRDPGEGDIIEGWTKIDLS